jgi:hypothetical protein
MNLRLKSFVNPSAAWGIHGRRRGLRRATQAMVRWAVCQLLRALGSGRRGGARVVAAVGCRSGSRAAAVAVGVMIRRSNYSAPSCLHSRSQIAF